MTRKLHNTLMAAFASSSLLVVGLIAGAPVAPKADVNSTSSELLTIAADVGALTDAIEQPNALPPTLTRAPRHGRQSPAMPFYSFAPRG